MALRVPPVPSPAAPRDACPLPHGHAPDGERGEGRFPSPASWRRPAPHGGWGVRVAVVALLVLAAVVRLANLATAPGWDGDEGYNYNIALNLMHGRHQM